MLTSDSAYRLRATRHKPLCRVVARNGMNLLELTAVVGIIGLVTTASISRFGSNAIGNGSAEGVARKLALSLTYARRSTIATGDNHYVRLNESGGNVVSFDIIRRATGGDTAVDETRSLPDDVSITSSSSTLEYEFSGSAIMSYSVVVSGPSRNYNVVVDWLTGSVRVSAL